MPIPQSGGEPPGGGVFSQTPALPGLLSLAGKLLPLAQVRELYQRVRQAPDGFQLENLLVEMRVELRVDGADMKRIPTKGPVVVVANHPFGMLDGAILAVLLCRVRPDVKVMTNFLLAGFPELEQHCIFVDPFQTAQSHATNLRALRRAVAWLHQGGMLAIFPAGVVSHWQLHQGEIADPEWNDTAARLVQKSGAAALPVYFCGRNSLTFQLLGLMHRGLRTAFLLNEFLQQSGKKVEVRVGSAIPAGAVASLPDKREAIEYLRWRTYLLGQRGRLPDPMTTILSVLPKKPQAPITPPLPQELVTAEVAALPADRWLAASGELSVLAAQAHEIPNLLQELGRLREITFRAAGEGTGDRSDLDNFDQYYWHLLLWNKAQQELIGAYRAGNTAEIIAARGIKGLYTSTLFRFDPWLFSRLGPALELGRSFVRQEYQRQYAPLLLLWKGIARFVAAHPETPILFGAVSISNTYSRASRELIVRFFQSRAQTDELTGLIQPRSPFRPGLLRRWDCGAMCKALRDLDELAEPITDLEVDGKGLPILLRQYAKVGGKLLGFNVDRKFSNVLDGLMMVDLRCTEPAVLERYMGREGLAGFRRFHRLD